MSEEVGQMTSDDIEAMATNPPGTATVTSAIWTSLPRQPKQIRCRQFLAHSEERRTYYWIIEPTGPVCQQCVNVRNTRAALAEQEASKSGNPGNSDAPSKNGKRKRFYKAPYYTGVVLSKRANGQSISAIARETKSSPNTVKKVLQETRFDEEIAQGRKQCLGLIPKAVKAVDSRLEKGDGELGRKFLNDVGVIGEGFNSSPAASSLASVFVNMQNLIRGDAPAQPAAEVIDVVPVVPDGEPPTETRPSRDWWLEKEWRSRDEIWDCILLTTTQKQQADAELDRRQRARGRES